MINSFKKIVVISPHPDDETLGVGGSIKKFTKIKISERLRGPGRHKNIYKELRPSFTRSKLVGNIYFLGKKRNTCCHRGGREVQREPRGNSSEK